MKTKFLNIIHLIILSYFNLNAQEKKILLLNIEDNKPIKYANVSYIGLNKGTYSDSLGEFTIQLSDLEIDSIKISSLGYKSTKYKVTNSKDTLFLKPLNEQLKEVVIKDTKPKVLRYGFKGKGNSSWSLNLDHELAISIIPNTKCNDCLLSSLSIPINKKTVKEINGKYKEIEPKFSTIMQLVIYSVKNDLPHEPLVQKPIFIAVNQNSPDEIIVDLKDEYIEFNEEGLFISLAKIENLTQQYNYMPLLRYTKKKSKNVISNSYYKVVFGDNTWKPINELKFNRINKDYNLALKLEVLEYE